MTENIEIETDRARLARFFREERPDLGFEGDVEGWNPVESAMAFLRREPRETTEQFEELEALLSLEEISCSPMVTRGDLARLDRIVTFFEEMIRWGLADMYDDAWNLRNHLVPFKQGDKHFDPEFPL